MSDIKHNFMYQAIYEIFIISMPLITSPYISRVLGAELIGVYSYTYSIAYYFVLFAMLGISNYGNRLVSSVRDDKNALNREFSSLLFVHIIVSCIICIIYILYCFIIVKPEEKIYSFIQFFFVASAIFDVNWFFFGIEQFKLSVIRNTIVKFISIILIFLFVKEKSDLDKYCFIMAAGILLSQIAIWPFLSRYVTFIKFNKSDLVKHIKPLLVLFVPVLAISVYKIMDKVMLGWMDTRESLGFYENAEKIVSVFTTAISAFGTVMLPRMNSLFAKGESETGNRYMQCSMKWMLIVTYAISFGVAGIAPNFVVLFWGSEFKESYSILSILALSLPFVAFASVIRMQYLIPKHKDKIYIISVSGGAIINFIINYLLIPQYAGVGAAIGTICAEGFVCVYQAWRVRHDTRAIINIIKSVPFLLLGITMYIVVRGVGYKLNMSLFIELLLQITIGAIIYLFCGLIIMLKNVAKVLSKFD